MPDIVGESVSTSKVAASVYEGAQHLVAVTTNDPTQQGTVAKQCPAAGTVVNENPKTGVPGVTLWIYQYEQARPPLTASAVLTDSRYSLAPLWLLSGAGGPYWLRITYDLPCNADVEDITLRVSTTSPNVNLETDNQGYLDEWSTESGGGPDGQQINCGTGRIVADDVDPTPWLGDGAITLTIGAITEPPSGAAQLTTLAELTLHFVQA